MLVIPAVNLPSFQMIATEPTEFPVQLRYWQKD